MPQIAYTPVGDFIFSIDILDPEGLARNSDGSFPDPVPFATNVPAAIKKLSYTSTGETSKSQQVIPEVGHEVIIFYLAGVKSRMLVKFRDRTFVIMRLVDPDEKQVELHLMCSERDDGK